MKTLSPGVLLTLLFALVLPMVTQAKIADFNIKPKKLNESLERQIVERAQAEADEAFECNGNELEFKDLKILSSELQDAEYAEYKGELSQFVLGLSVAASSGQCGKSGKFTCEMTFDLYDTKSYTVDSSKTVCVEQSDVSAATYTCTPYPNNYYGKASDQDLPESFTLSIGENKSTQNVVLNVDHTSYELEPRPWASKSSSSHAKNYDRFSAKDYRRVLIEKSAYAKAETFIAKLEFDADWFHGIPGWYSYICK